MRTALAQGRGRIWLEKFPPVMGHSQEFSTAAPKFFNLLMCVMDRFALIAMYF